MKHTPTPWKVLKGHGTGGKVLLIAHEGKEVTSFDPCWKAEQEAIQEANAAYIVRACNAHEANERAVEHGEYLAAAVQAFQKAHNERVLFSEMNGGDEAAAELDEIQGYDDALSDCWKGMMSAVHEFRKRKVQAALAKAEGK